MTSFLSRIFQQAEILEYDVASIMLSSTEKI